jgi:hypothetical protein
MLCNVYSVWDEKRMYTKIGIEGMVGRNLCVCVWEREMRWGKGVRESSFHEMEWEVLEEGWEEEEIFEDAI